MLPGGRFASPWGPGPSACLVSLSSRNCGSRSSSWFSYNMPFPLHCACGRAVGRRCTTGLLLCTRGLHKPPTGWWKLLPGTAKLWGRELPKKARASGAGHGHCPHLLSSQLGPGSPRSLTGNPLFALNPWHCPPSAPGQRPAHQTRSVGPNPLVGVVCVPSRAPAPFCAAQATHGLPRKPTLHPAQKPPLLLAGAGVGTGVGCHTSLFISVLSGVCG